MALTPPSSPSAEPDGTGLIALDPWLEPYADSLRHRYNRYRIVKERIELSASSLMQFAEGHRYFGFVRGEHQGKQGVWYREWAPGARGLSLIGDFNQWGDASHQMTCDEFGVWSIFVPSGIGGGGLEHLARVKVRVFGDRGIHDRLPAYIQRVVFAPDGTNATGIVYLPQTFSFTHTRPTPPSSPRIYEAHVGMSLDDGKIASFNEFRELVLPRIAKAGYNTIQLMAIQEHPYYGSFGYHVSNFFAVSSRFGTPEDFKMLVDAAHGMGLRIIMDLVHSHSVKNTVEGLSGFDGTEYQYFHAGGRGQHPAWDSLLFDYGKYEVQRFLLSNIRYWLEEYNIDGFRFDGVTSMMYLHHGVGHAFSGYDDYLRWHIDEDAVTYLQLANEVAHTTLPDCLCIAEDVSGMVGLCRPTDEGGIGFDYRLAMGLPDYWIKLLRESRDEDWNMEQIFATLCNRRHKEAHIAYCESHDQALVGDKTIAFWLMDKEMYWHMNKGSTSLVIDRGLALHKMIRLVTFALGGEGYLNFIGNEFGHPEWIDFPREGNGWSFHYCRRQWKLADDPALRYGGLLAFDRAMQALDAQSGLLASPQGERLIIHEDHKLLAFRRGGLTFVFNFHPTRSQVGLQIPVHEQNAAAMALILDTDCTEFGGFGLVRQSVQAPIARASKNQGQFFEVYVPARSAQVYLPGATLSANP